jgi:CheY-like chemotaxis protein
VGPDKAPVPPTAAGAVTPKILIVDDEADMAVTCARLLTWRGYTCLIAQAGADAIARMDTEAPDLVITDLHLPGMDGLAVTRHARNRRPAIPVILMTAYASAAAEGESFGAGATYYLAKPFLNAQLVELVQRALPAHARTPGAGPPTIPPGP